MTTTERRSARPGSGLLPLIALVAATSCSMVGSALTVVALPWFVLETTGSAGRAGLTAASATLPLFLSGLLGGALVDRIGFKRTAVASDLIGGLAIALIPALYHGPGLDLWQLLILVFLANTLTVPALSARRSMLPELAALGGVRLERANSAYELCQQIAMLVGPPIAGVLVAAIGANDVLWLDAGSFLLSAAVLSVAVPGLTGATAVSGGYLQNVLEGLRFLLRDRVLFTLAAGLFISNALSSPLFSVVLPVYANRELESARALGVILSASGVGAVVGTLWFGWKGYRYNRRALWVAAFLVTPVGHWILLAEPGVILLVAVYAVVEIVAGPTNPLGVTVRHERIPAELRGRVFSAFSAISMAATPLGTAIAGFAIEHGGFRPTVLGLAVAAQLFGVSLLFAPALRELDATRRASVDPH